MHHISSSEIRAQSLNQRSENRESASTRKTVIFGTIVALIVFAFLAIALPLIFSGKPDDTGK